jgi:hypothetical protein
MTKPLWLLLAACALLAAALQHDRATHPVIAVDRPGLHQAQVIVPRIAEPPETFRWKGPCLRNPDLLVTANEVENV